MTLITKRARRSRNPFPIDDASELALFRYDEVLGSKFRMCKDEGFHLTGLRLRDPASQLAQEHLEILGDLVLFEVFVGHESVVCFGVAGWRTLDGYGVIVWVVMDEPSV